MNMPIVDRSLLESRILNSGATLIEIIAPAGFGKTHLARVWQSGYEPVPLLTAAI